jgi:hypothetical protein
MYETDLNGQFTCVRITFNSRPVQNLTTATFLYRHSVHRLVCYSYLVNVYPQHRVPKHNQSLLFLYSVYCDMSDSIFILQPLGWAHKATLALRPFLIYSASPSDFLPFLIRPPELSVNYQHRYLLAKQDKIGEIMAVKFVYEVSLSYS